MKINNAFLPLSEKHVKAKVSFMSWSPKLDLLAIATSTGELLLYRLASREKIWSLPAPESEVNIVSLSWRPDGKVIAIAYDSLEDDIQFVYMEKAEILWKFASAEKQTKKTVVLIKWFGINSPQLHLSNKILTSDDFLPTVPDFQHNNSMYTTIDNTFHVLLIGDSTGCVTVYANGIFPIARVFCNSKSITSALILGMQITPNMDSLSVVVANQAINETETWALMCNLETLTKNIELYNAAAHKAYEVLSLKVYLSGILESVTELCDTVTQEVDLQLTSYLVKSTSTDTIGDDFLQLLIWGKPTESLRNILTQHLTKKEIKKLGQLIESSYTIMQQQLIVNFQTGLTALYYHLTEIRGMVADDKNILPFQVNDVDLLLKTTGMLLLKSSELLQVVDSSLKNFKAFFRWLYVSILKMQDEPVDEMGHMSGNEVAFVADFIYEHLTPRRPSDSKRGKQFHLDKVCQYLKDKPLSIPTKTSQNEWSNFVAASSILSNCDMILQPRPESSLKQIFIQMTNQLNLLIGSPTLLQQNLCQIVHELRLTQSSVKNIPNVKLWVKETETQNLNSKIVVNSEIFLLLSEKETCSKIAHLYRLGSQNSLSVKSLNISFNPFENESDVAKMLEEKNLEIVDFDPYDKNFMTFLLREHLNDNSSKSFLAQVELSAAIKELDNIGQIMSSTKECPTIGVSEMCSDVREMSPKVNGISVVAGGGRKVSCVLSSDSHHVYPFLMDHTEEDDDDFGEGEEE